MPALIGEEASIAHNAVIHGATIGARALIANGAQVLDGAVVGEGALVAAGVGGARRRPSYRRGCWRRGRPHR